MHQQYRIKGNLLALGRGVDELSPSALVHLVDRHSITRIEASGKMTDAFLKAIAGYPTIREMNLDGSDSLTDAGLEALSQMAGIERLALGGWHSQITDRGLQKLSELSNLKQFQICWARGITDAGIAALSECQDLESVNLMGTPTGDGAVRALKGKSSLRKLKTGRLLTDSGLSELEGFPCFANDSSENASFTLFSFEAEPTDLLIDGDISDKGLDQLKALRGLKGLSFFWHIKSITAKGIANLSRLTGLEFLGFGGELCDDSALAQIARLPSLRMLQGQETVATDAGFEALSKSGTIENFWGRECPNFGNQGFVSLSQMPSLRGLAISLKNVGAASLAKLKDFPQLRSLMPMDLSDDDFRYVGECTALENLSCMYCRETGDSATEHLRGLSNLKSYYAGQTRITDASLAILGGLSSLEVITLSQCVGLTTSGVRLLSGLPRLRELSISGSPDVDVDISREFPAEVEINID